MKQKQTATTAPAQLKVIARSPFHLYYDGDAQSVTATNRVGEFDILPGHADFFSVLSPGKVIIDTGEEATSQTITISNGIMTVRDNEVLLFLNI